MEELIIDSGMSLYVAIAPTPIENDEPVMDDDTTSEDCNDED